MEKENVIKKVYEKNINVGSEKKEKMSVIEEIKKEEIWKWKREVGGEKIKEEW